MSVAQQTRHQLWPHGQFRVRVLVAFVRNSWFIRLRWVFAAAALALLLLERLRGGAPERPFAIAVCIVVLAVVNAVWTAVGGRLHAAFRADGSVPSDVIRRVVTFANAQMTVDLLLLTIILRYLGGIESPMAVFYLFHMLIAALLLKPLNALLQGGWALLLYAGLGVGECLGWIAPHYPFMVSTSGAAPHTDWAFVLAGIGTLGIGVFGTLFFTLQISRRLDEQERELEQANEALQASQRAVETLHARRSRFMQTAAHQLKSPLTGIEMLAGLIRDGVVQGDRIGDTVERITSRCQEAIVQVTELLTLARLEDAEPTRHSSARTNIDEVVARVIGRLAEQVKGKGLGLEVVPSEGTSDAAVDARDLEDCLANLVDNAIKYTSEGGSIRVTTAFDDRWISVSVRDTGMGIAEDAVDDIFDPFRRGNLALAANIPGSGLGLAIVREVVEGAHGRIEVRSAPGEGSEFIVRFPRPGASSAATGIRGERTATLDNGGSCDATA
jgi:signal transduction histidine kinase